MALYKSKTDDGKCIFCEIIKGNLDTPGIFWENKDFMAFLSGFPSTDGNTVVVSKKHYDSDVLNMPNKVLSDFILASKKVSKILMKHYKDVGRVGLIIEGTGINHAHIKLIPMHGTEYMKKGVWKQYLSGKPKFLKKYMGYLSSNDGPKGDSKKLKLLAQKLKKIKL